MAFDINRIILRGRVGQKPETKSTDRYVRAAFTLATTHKDGQGEDRTEWHRVVCWDDQARTAARLVVGQAVLVEGELRHRSWETESGEKRYASEVVGLAVVCLALPKQHGPGDRRQAAPEAPPASSDEEGGTR